jgi:hypothetical protein
MNITNNQSVKNVNGIGQIGNNTFISNSGVENKNKVCFLVTPIGDDETEEREEADNLFGTLKLILKDYGFDVTCSLEQHNPKDITPEIIDFLETSDLVIINLTYLNPNVMYEFGYRKGIKKLCIPIARKGTILPFDTQDIRTIFYKEKTMVTDLQKKVPQAIQTIFPPEPPTIKDKPDNNSKSINQMFTKKIEHEMEGKPDTKKIKLFTFKDI